MSKAPLRRTPDASLYTKHDALNGREGKFTRIPKDDLRELVRKAQQGDMKAKDAVCREVYRYVLKRVAAYKRRGIERVEPDDLFQAGMAGVLVAIEKFEFERGFSFLTYVTAWIDQAIDREFQNTFSEVRIPIHVWGSYRQLSDAYRAIMGERKLEDEDDYEITVPKDTLIERALELAKGADRKSISRDTLESAYTYLLRGGQSLFTSLNQAFGMDSDEEDNKKTLANVLVDPNQSESAIEDSIMMDINIGLAREYLKAVDKRSRYILMRRYGICTLGEGKTLEEVGNELGVTRERIRQIELKATNMLKRLVSRCREGDMGRLKEESFAMYRGQRVKPFSVPDNVVLNDEEIELMSHELEGINTAAITHTGRVRLPGVRYKGRIVPDWFDETQVRGTAARKALSLEELRPEEIVIRFSMYGKRDLSKETLRDLI